MEEPGPSESQGARPRHRIVVCTSCKGKSPGSEPGRALIDGLRAALSGQCRGGDGFEVTGVACMAGCASPCTLAFQAEDKAFYLFGKLDPALDVPGLVEFARMYRERADGWSNSTERPASLRSKTLARIPAFAALRETPESAPEFAPMSALESVADSGGDSASAPAMAAS